MYKSWIFVEHIKRHLKEMSKHFKYEDPKKLKVTCKICNKDIDEIYEEETHFGIY